MRKGEMILPSLKKIISTLRPLFGITVSVLAVIFIGRYLWLQRSAVLTLFSTSQPHLLLISAIFFLLYYLCRILGWSLLLGQLGYNFAFKESAFIWTVSEAYRYIPGNVWSVVGRVDFLNAAGIKAAVAVSSWILEMILITVTSFISALVLILPVTGNLPLLVIILMLLGLVFINKKPVCRKLERVLNRHRVGSTFNSCLSLFFAPKLIAVYTAGWLFFGFGGVALTAAFVTVRPSGLLVISAVVIISWLIGYISLITPMGLGVREAAFIFLANNVLTAPVAVLISVSLRLCQVITEIVFLLFILILNMDKFVRLRRVSR